MKEGLKLTGKEKTEAEIAEIETYWASIKEQRDNCMERLIKGTFVIKPGRGYKRLDLSPDHLDFVEIPLSDAMESRLIASIHKINELLGGYKYRRDRETLRILRRDLKKNS